MSVPMPDTSGTEPVADQTITEPNAPTDTVGGENNDGLNPAWNDLLGALPSSLVPTVTPHLKKWDQNFETRLNDALAQYEPYKPFAENQIPPQDIEAAMGLYQLANTNPELLYREMAKFYGFEGQQQQQGDPASGTNTNEEGLDLSDLEGVDVEALLNHPKFKEMSENQQALAAVIVNQQRAQQEAQLNQQLDTEMNSILEKYPQFTQGENNGQDHQVQIYRIATAENCTLTEAAEKLAKYTQSFSAPPASPSVLSGNGRLPQEGQIDPTKLSDKDRRALVADIVKRSHERG